MSRTWTASAPLRVKHFFLFPDDSVRLKDCAVKVTINPISHRCPGKTPKMRHKIGAAPVLRLTQPQGESRRWDLVSSQVLPVGLVLRNWSQLTSNVKWIESISAICRRTAAFDQSMTEEVAGTRGNRSAALERRPIFGFKRRNFSIRWIRKKVVNRGRRVTSVGRTKSGRCVLHARELQKKKKNSTTGRYGWRDFHTCTSFRIFSKRFSSPDFFKNFFKSNFAKWTIDFVSFKFNWTKKASVFVILIQTWIPFDSSF